MHLRPPDTNNTKFYFTFEGRQYYVQHDAPGYVGMMIFTAGGHACEKSFHPELWFFYEHQKHDASKKPEKF